jgi:hypothetical protein
MKFVTISNLSGAVPIDEYVCNTTYCNYAVQPETYSGSDVVISLMDDEQNVVLISASCTVSEDEEEYRQDLNFGGADYDLDYTENTKNYRVSNISERAEKHKKIKTLRHNKKHIYVSVELPYRSGERSELFRFNEYGDLVIIIDDRNMEHIFGPAIKKLVENLRYGVSSHNNLAAKCILM